MEINEILEFELSKIIGIKLEKISSVVDHIKGDVDLNKIPPFLTVDEKKLKGINAKRKISVALCDVFEPSVEGIEILIGKISSAKISFQNKKHFLTSILEIKSNSLTNKFEFIAPESNQTCIWCKSNNGKKFSLNPDFLKVINEKCSCCFFNANAVYGLVDF